MHICSSLWWYGFRAWYVGLSSKPKWKSDNHLRKLFRFRANWKKPNHNHFWNDGSNIFKRRIQNRFQIYFQRKNRQNQIILIRNSLRFSWRHHRSIIFDLFIRKWFKFIPQSQFRSNFRNRKSRCFS